MKVTKDMIGPQLRLTGQLIDLVTGKNARSVEAVRAMAESPGLRVRLMDRLIPKPKGFQVEERRISRPDGTEMRLLVWKPLQPKRDVPGIVHIHGGGYHSGGPEQQLYAARFIEESGCVLVSPDYRLSVEAPYPAALDDCYATLLWLKDNAESLGVRDDQIAVMGQSAGGGLTAATTLVARDRGEVNVAFQMPLYPMIDDRNNSPSAKDNDAPVWNETTNEVGWRLYLGDRWGTDDVPAYAAPARATDFAGLPPTYTFVGALDPFCSETEDYVAALRAAGVPAELDVYDGAFHGFDLARRADVTKRAHDNLVAWYRRAIAEYTAEQPD